MAKILSKSGASLADTYDVVGSIAGIDDLVSREVSLVHEMGGTIFSERLRASIVPMATAAQAASTSWSINFTIEETARLLALAVISDDAGRVANCNVAIESTQGLGDAVPIWVWDSADASKTVRAFIAGVTTVPRALIPAGPPIIPNLLIGRGSPGRADIIAFRGTTTAFGAGTVTTTAIIYLAFPGRESSTSSFGLPLPGW